jgi:hypothetical protein
MYALQLKQIALDMKALHEDKSKVQVSYQYLGLSVCMHSLVSHGAVNMHVAAHTYHLLSYV